MAQKMQDSDNDEYEFMTGPSMADLQKENFSLNQTKGEKRCESPQAILTDSKCPTLGRKNKEDVIIKKQKNRFVQHLLKGNLKNAAVKHVKECRSISPPVTNTSPQTSTKGNVMQQQPPQILITDSPPKIGPKPQKIYTEEEKIEQRRQKHKEIVAATREKRSCRTSEPNPSPNYLIDHSYGELEINDIVNKYIDHLPLEVVVSRGIYGMEERYTLSMSDKCIIHYVKKRDLVRLQDPQTNIEFSVPLSSAIKFALVYNPNNDEEQACEGFNFPFVSDILAMNDLPKMGLAQLMDPNIEGLKSAELIVIKEVIFPANNVNPRKLRVYSLTAKCRRDLLETQEIGLNTCPKLIQTYLSDIMQHVPNPSSLHVAMFRNPLTRPLVAPGIPASMFQRPLFLKKRFNDILVIATGSSEGAARNDTSRPFEIPTDIDVEFEVIKHTQEEKDKLLEESRKLREELKDKHIRHHRYVGISEEEHRIQLSLYKSLREGMELEGGAFDETDDGDYIKVTNRNRLAIDHRVDLLEENCKRYFLQLTEIRTRFEALTKNNNALTRRVRVLEEQFPKHGMADDREGSFPQKLASTDSDQLQYKDDPEWKNKSAHLKMDTVSPESIISVKTTPVAQKGFYAQQEQEQKREMLLHMTIHEVAHMLQVAGLSEHTEIFKEEQVNGEVLMECDEEVLEHDLGIKSKSHRLKFLSIIKGMASADMYKLVKY